MSDFNVGALIWRPSFGTTQVRKPCPVCFGKLRVTVILGDDSLVDTPCDYCGKGWEGPKGYELVYESTARADADVVREVRVTTDENGQRAEYRLSSGHVTSRVFATKDEALASAEAQQRQHEAEQEERRKAGKEYSAKSYSWHVGYYARKIKDARRDIAYAEARLQVCKDAARIERAKKRKVVSP